MEDCLASVDARAFTGGRIVTMDGDGPEAEVVVVEGGRIAAVGDRSLLESRPELAVEPLHGRTLIPGLIDAHHHLSIAALERSSAALDDVTSVADLRRRLREQAEREPDTRWVRGVGWRALQFTRADLDAIGLDRPVIVVSFSLHGAVVSTLGLEELALSDESANPEGGALGRDSDGRLDGHLVEAAWSQASARSLEGHVDPERWTELIIRQSEELLAQGITCVHDAACSPEAETVYAELARAGRLPLSVLAMPHPLSILDNRPGRRLDGPPTGEGDEWFRVGALKLFADGGMAPAVRGTQEGRQVSRGFLMPGLSEGARRASERGFRLAVHAMGNVGMDAALAAFEAAAADAPGADHRFRVEHATLLDGDQIRRLAAVGGWLSCSRRSSTSTAARACGSTRCWPFRSGRSTRRGCGWPGHRTRPATSRAPCAPR